MDTKENDNLMLDTGKKNWFRLDNSASVYPMVITVSTQSLFRVGVEMTEPIDPDDVKLAVDKAFLRFPYYKVELRSGIFRHSFLRNNKEFRVFADDGVLLERINFHKNNNYLFRVSYYKNKLIFDVFHGLCDGRAAMEFVKAVLYHYLQIRGNEVDPQGKVKLGESYPAEEITDGFSKFFEKIDIVKGTKKMAGKNAFMVKGKRFRREGFGTVYAYVSASELLKLSKSYGCGITAFVAALAMLSVIKVQSTDTQKNDLAVFVPVDLRNAFGLDTQFNFTTFVKCKIPLSAPRTLESYVEIISTQLKSEVEKENLQTLLSFTSLLSKSRIFRFAPLCVKALIAKIGRVISPNTKQTMIVSNVGRVDLPDDIKKHCNNVFYNLNCSKKTPKNLALVSLGDKMVMTFTRQTVDTEVEKEFFRSLVAMGVKVGVTANFMEEQDKC